MIEMILFVGVFASVFAVTSGKGSSLSDAWRAKESRSGGVYGDLAGAGNLADCYGVLSEGRRAKCS